MNDKLFIRFNFDPDKPEDFFKEDLPSILHQYAALALLGCEVAGVDLTNRKINLCQDTDELDEIDEIEQEKVENLSKVCQTCRSFIDSKLKGQPGSCQIHNWATKQTDTCDSWSVIEGTS